MKKIFIIIFVIIFIVFLIFVGTLNNKEKVVIYSSMEEERNQALKEQLKKQFPDINVVVQYIATGNCSAKLKTEGTNIEADIIIDLETAHIKTLQENFADISNYDSSIYIKGLVESKNYFPWAKYATSIIIDKKYFKEHNLKKPKTYQDLLKKEYKNLIAIPDPKTSGTGYAFFLNAVNIMGEDEAVKYFKSLKENLREFTISGAGPTNLLKQGEIAIAMGMTSQGAKAITEGYDFEIISLETGTPFNTTSYGIIKGRENNDNVKNVFEWVSTEFIRYDKENYMPDKILKKQKNNVKNYPNNFKEADMTGLEDIEVRNNLIEKWRKIDE